MRQLIAALAKAETAISKDCATAYRALLSAFPRTATQADIERRNARFRERYHRRAEYERARTANYKARNWERKLAWDETRRERIEATSDGSLTDGMIRQMKAQADQCWYCGERFTDHRPKQTDHIVPLAKGGSHTRENVVIVCAQCNASKGMLDLGQWAGRLYSKVLPGV